MPRIYLTKSFKFEAAHQLPNYMGKCANLHGHTYTLEVQISGEDVDLDKSGILMDFGAIKGIVNTHVVDQLDHKYLNDIFPVPSAEYMCIWIFNKLTSLVNTSLDDILEGVRIGHRARATRVECVRLNEGGGSNWAEVRFE